MLNRMLVLALVVTLVGCAKLGLKPVEPLKSNALIIPLSMMGDTMSIHYVGTTVFQNEHREVSVANWKIDNYVEATIAQVLKEGKRFQVKVVDTTSTRAIAQGLDTVTWSGDTFVKGGTKSIIDFARETGADYVLAVGDLQMVGDPFFRTNQQIRGFGI